MKEPEKYVPYTYLKHSTQRNPLPKFKNTIVPLVQQGIKEIQAFFAISNKNDYSLIWHRYDFFCLRLKYQRIKQASLTPPVVSRHNNVKRAPHCFHFFSENNSSNEHFSKLESLYIPSSATRANRPPSFMTRAAISWKKAT